MFLSRPEVVDETGTQAFNGIANKDSGRTHQNSLTLIIFSDICFPSPSVAVAETCLPDHGRKVLLAGIWTFSKNSPVIALQVNILNQLNGI